MNILVTGGSGFVGKNLLEVLPNSSRVIAISRKKRNSYNKKNIKFFKSSLKLNNSTFEKIKKFRPKVLVHMAWSGIPDYSKKNSNKNLKEQIFFFKKILLINSIKKILVTGSCSEKKEKYQFTSKYFVNAKKALNTFLKKKCKEIDVKLIWLRLFFLFGKYQKKNSLISYLISNIKKNKKILIKKPNAIVDYIYIKSACEIMKILLFNYNRSLEVDIGSGSGYKISEIAKLLQDYKKNIFYKNKLRRYKKNVFKAKLNKTLFSKVKINSIEKNLRNTFKNY